MSSFGKSLCAKTEKARRIMINKELNPYLRIDFIFRFVFDIKKYSLFVGCIKVIEFVSLPFF
jgi:hypothetical protein